MNKSASPFVVPSAAPTREPRPFSYLKPRLVTTDAPAVDVGGRAILMACAQDHVPALVRGLIRHTIALQNRRGLETGWRQPIQVSVLNRRRRAARAWVQAVVTGAADLPTLHAAAVQWLPTLCGNGLDRAVVMRTAHSCVEFVRGAITALLFDRPTDNLLGNARALHVLETVLAAHLAATEETHGG